MQTLSLASGKAIPSLPIAVKKIKFTTCRYPNGHFHNMSGVPINHNEHKIRHIIFWSLPYLNNLRSQWKVQTLSTRSLRPLWPHREGSIHWVKLFHSNLDTSVLTSLIHKRHVPFSLRPQSVLCVVNPYLAVRL